MSTTLSSRGILQLDDVGRSTDCLATTQTEKGQAA